MPSIKTPIFCINLERATERKQKIQKTWTEELGFDITFWKAWDRRDIENGKYYFPYDSELTQKRIKRDLHSGQIACVTSHCMVHEYCVKNNIENYIVMEDDIYPTKIYKSPKDLEYMISQGSKEFPEASIYMLNKCAGPYIINDQKSNFCSLKSAPWGNQINFYNKNGRDKMYNSLKSISCLADHWKFMEFVDTEKDIIIINQNRALGYHEYTNQSTTYIGNCDRRIKRKFIE
jgi:GR25 family glycosyltransferase involved in LPS biosynthesis